LPILNFTDANFNKMSNHLNCVNLREKIEVQKLPYIEISGNRYEADLIIFDKDGTLLDFRQTWLSIFRELISLLLTRTGPCANLSRRIQEVLGMNFEKWDIDGNGPLAMGTSFDVDVLLAGCVYREGIRWDKSIEIVSEVVQEVFKGPIREKNLIPSKGAIEVLRLAKQRGFLTAVATNDNTIDATNDMSVLGALPYLDLVVGADSVGNAKPAPDMIFHICEILGKKPENTVMIGDTMMDAIMGATAGIKLNIGIAEIVPAEILATKTDIVIRSMVEIG
jgi:phosphoglycolate phosphatase